MNQPLSAIGKAILPILFLASCVKMDQAPATVTPDSDVMTITPPDNFDYQTFADVNLDITLLTNSDLPLENVLVNIMDKAEEDGGKVLFTALTNNQGKIASSVKLPTYLKTVVVDAQYIGLMRNATVRVESKNVLCTIGGANGFAGNVEPQNRPAAPGLDELNTIDGVNTYKYMGTYTTDGKPNYLVTPNDVISAAFLANVNASLPEQKPVPQYHPDYLTGNVETNLHITATSDIFITFVHEGAGYLNSLAYFTYPTNNPPTTTAGIDTVRIILPNASLNGSGGKLESGNKVLLGRFNAGTSIGFCVIANGWNNTTKLVGAGNNKFFSIDALNPETTAAARRHTVLLKDASTNRYLVGFEDLHRQNGSDDDFNDLIFYATSSTVNAISTTNVNPIDSPTDTDGDGVSNVYDKFPTDPTRAYINYYPAVGVHGSIAFEDTWPATGDYDMNDLIVGYQYRIINNAQNKTVEVFGDFVLKASGAKFNNGFGVQFPFAPSLVSSVTGSRATNNVTSFNANGTESGQSKAVIIPFDDFYTVMASPGNAMVNSVPGVTYIKPDTVKMKVSFTSPITATQLGTAPFNQFMIARKTRGQEIHLPGEKPTDKANTALFNTQKDNTIPSQNKYYKTKTNLPFAIALPEGFDYPIEGKAINLLFLKFEAWAQSGGTVYPDWYQKKTGYRLANYFYTP